MKLPNFLVSREMLRLKRAMGIADDKLGNVREISVRRDKADREEIRRLAEDGLEVDIDAVQPLEDGTLSYKDRRVLLYIRDVAQYGGEYSDPRFHFANCSTVRQMRANLRFGRYVIASRDDGMFHLHYVTSGRRTDKRLDVCQNCLTGLSYKGFQHGMAVDAKRDAVVNFSIAEFFMAYPKILHHTIPAHTDRTSPTNDYSADFAQVSLRYRQLRSWQCEACGIDLARKEMQRYLHVHHINGLKNENHEGNLKAVCIRCHALEPMHGHVTAMRQFREFEPIWTRWRKSEA